MRKVLYLIRGLPGSAKTTLAKKLCPGANFAADDWFERGGGYEFDPAMSGAAHLHCQARLAEAMAAGTPEAAVANTFVESWEAEPYWCLAAQFGYSVHVVESQGDFGSVHGVPDDIVMSMMRRWHRTLKPPREAGDAAKLAEAGGADA